MRLSGHLCTGAAASMHGCYLALIDHGLCSGPLPAALIAPNLEQFDVALSGLETTEMNSYGDFLPEYLEFDTCAQALFAVPVRGRGTLSLVIA